MCPQPLQSREHVAVLRQFHLRLGIGGLCAHGEDVENERGAVEDLHLQYRLDVSDLLGRQLVVEDDHTHLALGILFSFDEVAYFLQLAFTYIGDGTRSAHSLCETLHSDGTGGVGEEFQFVEVFLCFRLVLFLGDEAHQNGSLGLCFGDNKFFHVDENANILQK